MTDRGGVALQVARVSAVGVGVVYGSIKLGILKVPYRAPNPPTPLPSLVPPRDRCDLVASKVGRCAPWLLGLGGFGPRAGLIGLDWIGLGCALCAARESLCVVDLLVERLDYSFFWFGMRHA